MDPAFVQRLHALLQQSTAPDTNLIKSATASLNTEFYRDAKCIPALFEIVSSAPEQTIRQIASVELRKRISQKSGALWIQVPQDIREVIKSKALEIVSQEQIPIVRHAISRVIAAIAEIELGASGWPALLPWLNEMTSSPVATSREVGIYVIYTSIEAIIDSSPAIIYEFIQHFSTLLSDPQSLEVRVTSFRSLVVLAQYLESNQKREIAAFQTSLPAMVAVIQSSIEAGNTEAVRHGIDGFETLLILETPLLSKHIPQLVEFFTTIGANRAFDSEYRVLSLNALSWIIKYKKNKVQSLNLAKPILDALLVIGAEPEPEDLEDEAPARSAFRVVDALATALPPSHVFNPLYELVKGFAQSPDPALRKSALTSLGLAVEGCSEYIRPQVRTLWPLVDAGLADPVAIVRNAACIAFGCLCEWLPEECKERHEALLPVLMALIQDPESQSAACTALDAFLEILDEQIIAQYITLIMERLGGLLETGSYRVKSLVTGAIGSAAHASGAGFKPFFPITLERLRPFFSLTAEGEEQELRGIAMDALGTLAEAIGKEDFRPYLGDTMTMAMAGSELGSARLKECSFLLYAVLARLFEKDFSVYLATIVPPLLASCSQLEHGEDAGFANQIEAALNADPNAFSTGAAADDDDASIDIGDEDSADGDKALEISSAIAVEKEIAADTLGILFASVEDDFLPYLEQSTNELIKLLDHYYEGIRKSAVSSLFEFIKTFYSLSKPEPWQPGVPVSVPLHDKVKELINMVIPAVFLMWDTEDDKSVASTLCQGLAEAIAKIGPGLVEPYLNEVCTYTLQILERKALCQQDPDQEETDEVDDEQAEYESVLIAAASDIVGALASVIGPDFAQAFDSFMPAMFKFYTKNSSASDRSSSIGTLGEVITGLKGGVTRYTDRLLAHIVKGFSDSEVEVRSNAAFAVGVLIENSEQDLTSQYMNVLISLRPYFEIAPGSEDSSFIARDNAVGAVSRMITKNMPPAQIEQVLPTLVGALPLTKDFLENRPLFTALFYLFQNSPQIVTPYLDQLLPVFARVLDPNEPDQIGDEARAQLISLVRALNPQVPDKIAASGLQAFVS